MDKKDPRFQHVFAENGDFYFLVGCDPVERAKRAKQITTRYAGARRWLYQKDLLDDTI